MTVEKDLVLVMRSNFSGSSESRLILMAAGLRQGAVAAFGQQVTVGVMRGLDARRGDERCSLNTFADQRHRR